MSKLLELAPPGQIEQMAKEMTGLTGKNYDSEVLEYLEENFGILMIENTTVMVSKYNRKTVDGSTIYYDINGQFKLENGKAIKVGEAIETDYTKMVPELQQWIVDFYPNGVIRVFDTEEGLHVCINSTAVKQSAFWGAHWLSHYFIPKQGNITASIKILLHYYEDGNVQMNCHKSFTVDPLKEVNCKSILEVIKTVEQKYHEQVKTADMTDTFKNLRRQLPLTKQEIEWEKVFYIHIVMSLEMETLNEMEMLTDMFNRISMTCRVKCLTLPNGDLSKGESVCLDRCVAKYFNTNVIISKFFQDLQASKQ